MIKPQNMKILIAEDEGDLRHILASRFQVFGFQTFEASNGKEAYELYKSNPEISTIVTDILMPKMNGIELLNKLKSEDPIAPKIFVASANLNISIRELFALGAEGYIEKPYATQALIEMVRKSLLSNKERWQMPPNFIVDQTLEEGFTSLEEAIRDERLQIGRGGLSIKSSFSPSLKDGFVKFKINAAPLNLEGVARIKWREEVHPHLTHLGLEFCHIGGPNSASFYDWIESHAPVAYIPG